MPLKMQGLSLNDSTISENLAVIRDRIACYAQKYGRKDEIHLLAASKGQSIPKILAAIHAHQYHFGENYLQEALTKINALSAYPELTWHFIGSLQRNKTRKVAEHFSWVHSVCRKDIACRLNEQRPAHLPALNICLEVNISGENGKTGTTTLQEVLELANYCSSLPRLHLRGLMTVPQVSKNMPEARTSFHQLFLLWQSLRQRGFALDTLSMGMSQDFEAAIAEGSTLIRIGTAIFGRRMVNK